MCKNLNQNAKLLVEFPLHLWM